MIRYLRHTKRYSLFTLVLIAITIGTTLYLPFSTIADYYDQRDQLILRREKRLVGTLEASGDLFRAGADEALTRLLRRSLTQGISITSRSIRMGNSRTPNPKTIRSPQDTHLINARPKPVKI